MSEFKVGDVVRLKSWGPAMTIRRLEQGAEGKVTCDWFHPETMELKVGVFKVQELEVPPAEDEGYVEDDIVIDS
ncbi:MAG: DUF2158 domain-containing protein [Candidatus Latescibacteria bacterium]|nr:DUF2158 domain-containing protein [Candidatus Latescibacterota bacterium]